MNGLNKYIDNKENFSPCYFYIKKFDVKQFCELHEYHYSSIPTFRLDDKIGSISEIHSYLKKVKKFSKGEIIVHIDYTVGMSHNSLKSLLSDHNIDNRVVIILTNNKGIKGLTGDVTDLIVNYIPRVTGFPVVDLLSKMLNVFKKKL